MRRTVLIVICDKVNIFTLMSMVEAFTSVNFHRADKPDSHYDVRIVSPDGGMVKAWNGYNIDTAPISQFENVRFDTLILSGGWGFLTAIRDRRLVAWVAAAAQRCRRICAVGGGLFLAAEAGLLANRRVAMHPIIYGEFSRRYLSCIPDQNAVFTHDGAIWTSPGMSAAVDVALAMIEEDLGRAAAMTIARFLVVYVKRSGEEPQVSPVLESQSNSDKFEDLHAWILANLSSRLTLAMLARKAGMSVRNFSRAYAKAFGRTPMEFVQTARLDIAARALTTTGERISQIAYESGFSSDEQMRRSFLARFGMSPSSYRIAEAKASKESKKANRKKVGGSRSRPGAMASASA